MSDFFESELTRELAPVAAPASLWLGVAAAAGTSAAPRTSRARAGWRVLSPAVAFCLLTLAAGSVWKTGPSSPRPAQPDGSAASLAAWRLRDKEPEGGTAVKLKADARNNCLLCHTGATLYETGILP